MSQLAPFRQEPFFAKNGTHSAGRLRPSLALRLGFRLSLGLGLTVLATSLAASLATTLRRSKRLLVAPHPDGRPVHACAAPCRESKGNCLSWDSYRGHESESRDLLFCITALTLPLGSGVGLVCSGLRRCLGCGLDFRLELRKLLLGVGELARVGVCAGARGCVDGVGYGLVGRFPLLELQDPLCGTPPTSGVPSTLASRQPATAALSALISFWRCGAIFRR